MKKVSIVMAYYNRRKLLMNTLKSIQMSKEKDNVEIIIVDDASDDKQNIDDINKLFNLDIKIIKIKKGEKWWMNPCIPYNIGFKYVSNDIVIIQNPECLHFGDIVRTVVNNIEENKYLNFACYSIDSNKTELISKIGNNNINNQIGKIITPMNNKSVSKDGETAWYNHSVYRPHMLHFCSAIMKKDLDDLGGFDERFANGIAYDDNEFLLRIKRKGMNINIIDSPFVIHQFHGVTQYGMKQEFVRKNAMLYQSILNENSKNYKANI